MCGIGGIIDLKGRKVERPILANLCARLAHRGPDDEGYYLNGHAGLAQRARAGTPGKPIIGFTYRPPDDRIDAGGKRGMLGFKSIMKFMNKRMKN